MAINQAVNFSEVRLERLQLWLATGVFPGILIALAPAVALTIFLELLHARITGVAGGAMGIAFGAAVGGVFGRWCQRAFDSDSDLGMLPVCGALVGAIVAASLWLLRDPPSNPPLQTGGALRRR